MLPVPPVRADCRSAPGTVIFDGQPVELAPEARQVFELLDGQRRFPEVIATLHELGIQVPVDEALLIIRQAAELDLLQPPDWDALPVELLEGARFACSSTGDCCRTHEIGPLASDDIERLEARELAASLVEVQSDEGTRHFLKKDDGACVFLDPQTLKCRLHEQFGPETKPRLCQVFPARVAFLPGAVRMSLGVGCSCRHLSRQDGEPLEAQIPRLRELFRPELRHQSPFGIWTLYLPSEEVVPLTAEARLSFADFRRLEDELLAGLAHRELTVEQALESGLAEALSLAEGEADERSRAERVAALTLVLHFCQLVLDLAGDAVDAPLRQAVERLKEHMLKGPAEVVPENLGMASPALQDLARDFLRNELWTLHPLQLGRPYLAGLVLLSYSYILSKWLALQLALDSGSEIDEACFHQAFHQIDTLLGSLQLDDSAGLIPFARAPDLGPGGLGQYRAL